MLVMQALFQYGPDVARMVKNIAIKPDVTEADIDALIAKVEQLNFDASRNRAQALLDAEKAAQ